MLAGRLADRWGRRRLVLRTTFWTHAAVAAASAVFLGARVRICWDAWLCALVGPVTGTPDAVRASMSDLT